MTTTVKFSIKDVYGQGNPFLFLGNQGKSFFNIQIERNHMRKSGNFFQKVCANPALRNLVRSRFLVTFKPLNCNHTTLVKKEFLEISRRANFRKIQTHMSFDRVRERRNIHHRRCPSTFQNYRNTYRKHFRWS